MSTYISAANILATSFQANNPPKEITSPNGEKYTRTYLSYNYGSADRPYLSEGLFELKICKGKVKINAKKAYKLNLTITDPADLAGLSQLSLGLAYCVEKYKNKFGLRNFDPHNPGDFRGAFFYPASEDGELIAGASPIVSLKMNEKTKFKVLKPKINPETNEPIMVNGIPEFDEEPIDYKSLVDKQIDCSVVINPRDLYRSGGTPYPQIFVRSCMILNISDSGEVDHTKSEMVRGFLQQNPEILNSLAEQIAKLKVGTSTNVSLLQPEESANNIISIPPVNSSSNNVSSPAPVSAPIDNTPSINMQLPQFNNNSFSTIPATNNQFQLPHMGQSNGIDLTSYLNNNNQPANYGVGL